MDGRAEGAVSGENLGPYIYVRALYFYCPRERLFAATTTIICVCAVREFRWMSLLFLACARADFIEGEGRIFKCYGAEVSALLRY